MKFVYFANTDWYLYNFRLAAALELASRGHEVVMLSPPGDFGARFSGHGLRWVTLAMNRASLNPWREAMTLQALAQILKQEQPDLLHSFTVKCAVYGALASRMASVPAVVNAVAGMGYVFACEGLHALMLRPVVRTLMRNTLANGHSRLILQNADDADAFTRMRVPEQRIRVIRSSGVDTTRFSPEAGAPGRRPLRVLLAARLLWDKGIGEFVEASRQLKAEGRDIEFLLAGTPDPGNPRSVAQAQVDAWASAGLVDCLGHVEDMPALMRSVDVMALPSYYREGVPRSLIEAAACGLALVTTNLPGCREVVSEDGVDGLHVVPRDAASLAAGLARLDDDRGLVRRLGERSRDRALMHFDERRVIEATMGVYEELLPGRVVRNEPCGARV